MEQKYYLIFGVIVLLGAISISAYFQQQNRASESGFLEGKISIGPLCPVERFPQDPSCQPTEETYEGWPIAVYASDKKTKIMQIKPNLDGTYKIELPVGDYIIDLEEQQPLEIGGNSLPSVITINSEKTTTLNVDIDTGVR